MRLLLASDVCEREAYVISHKGNADIDTLDHVQKVRLENEGLSGMIEHSSRSIELLKVRQVLVDIFHDLEQLVLMMMMMTEGSARG